MLPLEVQAPTADELQEDLDASNRMAGFLIRKLAMQAQSCRQGTMAELRLCFAGDTDPTGDPVAGLNGFTQAGNGTLNFDDGFSLSRSWARFCSSVAGQHKALIPDEKSDSGLDAVSRFDRNIV